MYELDITVKMPSCGMWRCVDLVNRRFGGKYCLHLQGRKIREQGTTVSRWLDLAVSY
jgi:hypothetical protein